MSNIGDGRYWILPLECYNHESIHFVVLDMWENDALTSIPWNRWDLCKLRWKIDEIHTTDGLEDSKHGIDDIRYVVLLFYSFVYGYLQWSISHKKRIDT